MTKAGAWPPGSDRGAALSPSTVFYATCYSKSILFIFFPVEQILHSAESIETYKAL